MSECKGLRTGYRREVVHVLTPGYRASAGAGCGSMTSARSESDGRARRSNPSCPSQRVGKPLPLDQYREHGAPPVEHEAWPSHQPRVERVHVELRPHRQLGNRPRLRTHRRLAREVREQLTPPLDQGAARCPPVDRIETTDLHAGLQRV
jgi:hypothetical protein